MAPPSGGPGGPGYRIIYLASINHRLKQGKPVKKADSRTMNPVRFIDFKKIIGARNVILTEGENP